ncbi:uncharacterized protein TRIADDRAFT_58664 [Trichoplax adhaerens]|uniref:C2 DOCK-type domain-containing protein n=1 Tax=Trichoplax adhaerens TaxID=10228 RepID=B3S3C0_TRIAD|nr:hypothetical protein TRIADDRAFT_58664 [Trichoplax adhaerens]EDV22941.1 hypothetical protein TRIADDRAFT_58664 [Trichoplax adhaerens]|eukprot:XP_002114807.1 hypothetical protein TRIADDRAFT_58664 [Trichoplax adhaerens]
MGTLIIASFASLGWYWGYVVHNESRKGVFPANYITLKDYVLEKQGVMENIIPKEKPLVIETVEKLREYGDILKMLYLNRDQKFLNLVGFMYELMEYRQKIIYDDVTPELIHTITAQITYWNRVLKLDVTLRNERGDRIEEDELTVMEIYEKGFRNENSQNYSDIYNLFVNFKHGVLEVFDQCDAILSLYDATTDNFISESMQISLNEKGMPVDLAKDVEYDAFFTDLDDKDMNSKLFLVCQLVRIGAMHPKSIRVRDQNDLKSVLSRHKDPKTFGLRRPYGVAVYDLKNTLTEKIDNNDVPMHVVCYDNESLYSTIKKAIKQSAEKKGASESVWVSLKLLRGYHKDLRRTHPLMIKQSTKIVGKFGFPEVIVPGDDRNDMFISIASAELDKTKKGKQKSLQLLATVVGAKGNDVSNGINMGKNEHVATYSSVVYHQENCPVWMETFKLGVTPENFKNLHIIFRFRNRHTGEAKVLGLLKWNASTSTLKSTTKILENFMDAEKPEVVKFLVAILDVIFKILSKSDQSGTLPYKALVFVLCTIEAEKFRGFKKVFDSFIENHFKETSVHLKLLIDIKKVLTSGEQGVPDTVNVLQQLLRLAIKSEKLHERTQKDSDGIRQRFITKLIDVLSAINNLMPIKSEFLLSSQGPILNHVYNLVELVLRPIMSVVSKADPFSSVHLNYATLMIALFSLMEKDHFSTYFASFHDDEDLIDLLNEIYTTFLDLIRKPIYKSDWHIMLMTQNAIMLNVIRQCFTALTNYYLHDNEGRRFNYQISRYAAHPRTPNRKCLEKVGFLVSLICFMLMDMLGKFKINFIPGIVGPLLEVALLPNQVTAFQCFRMTRLCNNNMTISPALSFPFVQTITLLIEKLLDYHTVHNTYESLHSRLHCTVNLLNFYKDIQKDEMYVRYVYKLRDLHLEAKSYIEAGYTLLLHAELLKVIRTKPFLNNKILEIIYNYYSNLPFIFISCFTDHNWEDAIGICKRLVVRYETEEFDYEKLSAILNKTFIYRGRPLEQIIDFQHRMQRIFPDAQVLSTLDLPEKSKMDSDKQYLQICKADPVCDMDRFADTQASERIKRPFHKGKKETENEFAIEIDPLEYAIESVQMKVMELKDVIERAKQNPKGNINNLGLQLNGILDAAVNGGIAQYAKVFFTLKYLTDYPEREASVNHLKELILYLTRVAEEGVEVHGDFVKTGAPTLQPLHDKITSNLVEFQGKVNEYHKPLYSVIKRKKESRTARRIASSKYLSHRPSIVLEKKPISLTPGDGNDILTKSKRSQSAGQLFDDLRNDLDSNKLSDSSSWYGYRRDTIADSRSNPGSRKSSPRQSLTNEDLLKNIIDYSSLKAKQDDFNQGLSGFDRLTTELRLSASSASDVDKDEMPILPPKNTSLQISDSSPGAIPAKPPRYRSTSRDGSSENYLSSSLTDSSHAGPLNVSPALPIKTVPGRHNTIDRKASKDSFDDSNRSSTPVSDKRRDSLPQFKPPTVSSDESSTPKSETVV